MSLFSKGQPPAKTYRLVPSNAKTTAQWRAEECKSGCTTCGRKGCDRTQHSYSSCGGCSSPYCNGDACPGRRGRIRK